MNASAPLDHLQAFRNDVYHCFDHRSDALFNLFDAITVAGLVPSFAHLSLQGPFKRGHGSLYAALTALGTERVRALVGTTLNHDQPLVFAIDTSTWIRNDAETSPQRGYFYHPSRHSAGKPVVAGWSSSWVAQLGPVSSRWTAPSMCVESPLIAQRTRLQMNGSSTSAGCCPQGPHRRCSCSMAGITRSVCRSSKTLTESASWSVCGGTGGSSSTSRLVRVPREVAHAFMGAKFLCADQTTWPAPHLKHMETTEQYGTVHVRAWTGLHVKTTQDTRPGSRHFKPTYSGMVVVLEVAELLRETRQPQAFWLWWRGPVVPNLAMLWRAYTRRFDLEHTFRFCKQTLNWETPRLRHPEQADR